MRAADVYYEIADDIWVDGQQSQRGVVITAKMAREHIDSENLRGRNYLVAAFVFSSIIIGGLLIGAIYMSITYSEYIWIVVGVGCAVFLLIIILVICAARLRNHPRFSIRRKTIGGERIHVITPIEQDYRLLRVDNAESRFV
jgi:hypothetical protein